VNGSRAGFDAGRGGPRLPALPLAARRMAPAWGAGEVRVRRGWSNTLGGRPMPAPRKRSGSRTITRCTTSSSAAAGLGRRQAAAHAQART